VSTAIGSTPLGESPRLRAGVHMPAWLELLAVVAAIALLWPAFERIADGGGGRDRRFAETAFAIEGLPDEVLPQACAAWGARAETAVAERLCRRRVDPPAPMLPGRMPADLARASARAVQAFTAPMQAAEARIEALRRRQQDGSGDVLGIADEIAAIEGESRPFAERYRLVAPSRIDGPVPLACAERWLAAALAAPRADHLNGAAADRASANALLLFAAALDGRAATDAVAQGAVLPVAKARLEAPCDAAPADTLAAAAALMGDARQAVVNGRKNVAMLALIATAGPQWVVAMLLGYAFLVASRRIRTPAFGIAAALALWTLAAWAARVPWPLAGARAFIPARLEPAFDSAPAPFVWAFGALALVVATIGAIGRDRRADLGAGLSATLSSRIGYAGFVLASGLGWLLLLDLSANGHPGNRYLALYHQGHLWLGMLVLSVLLFLRRPLARELGWLLSVIGEGARAATRRLGTWGAAALVVAGALAAVAGFGLALANMRQLTSELGRVWLIVGAAWFFFLRAGPLTERLAQRGGAGLSFWRYAWPMLFVVAVLVLAMLVTRDMGPLLIAGYGAGAFLAATVAMWWHRRTAQRAPAFMLAVGVFALWIGGVTAALFEAGSVDSLTATRLESVAAPFASTNDQLALVAWFQRAAPADGFGLGAVPWCGQAAGGGCSGVPAQIHSDYTFTAIVGAFGMLAAWTAVLGCAVWLHRLIRHHGRVTRGEPRLLRDGAGGHGLDGQAFLSWIAVAWVVLTSCQLAVTVAGNVAVLPLTGVTFPFVSFGMTSLLVNLAFLALCLNVDTAGRRVHGHPRPAADVARPHGSPPSEQPCRSPDG
jgi:cell division protein FtsW (lipid II flippase)